MKVRLNYLHVRTRRSTETIKFTETVTFLYGPVGTGKSTVARLVDYCFGGDIERTPAIQQEFISVILGVCLGKYECTIERGADDTQAVRVTWNAGGSLLGSTNAPLAPAESPLLDAEVFNLSDLLFYLCGVEPIKVPQRTRDPDSPMIRLSFRDIWRYCYLDQAHLDSSCFRLEDPFRGRKSQDAMRFFTGLHSEKLSQLQTDLYRVVAKQQGAREAVEQIRRFMTRFEFGSELELIARTNETTSELSAARTRKRELEETRSTNLHPTDDLRNRLRQMGAYVSDLQEAISSSAEAIEQQTALRAELITAKVKTGRAERAGDILGGVAYSNCPQCGSDISARPEVDDCCRLCRSTTETTPARSGPSDDALRREINDRIDQISDSLYRRNQVLKRSRRELQKTLALKHQLDAQLQDELRRYDSAFVESVRSVDREIATLEERHRSLVQLQEMPRAIAELEEEAGASQGLIDRIRSTIDEERHRLRGADENAKDIADKFKEIMLEVGFPGVSQEDQVLLDPRNWRPTVRHAEQDWGFWDTGSGGKKTLFNVCYAVALHTVALNKGLPVPKILIVDSPTKNISEDENPELVHALYREIYRLASDRKLGGIQLLLIDSDLVVPENELEEFSVRRLAGVPEAPSLISYYVGP